MPNPFDYQPIIDREPLVLPGDAKAAFWIGVNTEFFQSGKRALSFAEFTAEFDPDPMNVAWREYGSRVGVFRMIEGLADVGAPVTGIVNGAVFEEFPQIIREATEAGWSWVAHGWDNSTLQTFLPDDVEPGYIERVTQTIERATGTRPRGWLGPVLAQSKNTLDLLADAGYDYNLDWGCDDAPFDFNVSNGRLVSVPYSVEVNDIPAFLYQHQTPDQFANTIRAHVDQIVTEGGSHPRVLGLGVHPFLVGQPARFGAFKKIVRELVERDDVFVTTADAVADLYLAQN